MAKLYGLGRAEKLKSRKRIEQLFQSGSSFAQFPLRAKYHFFRAPGGVPAVQMGVTVSKKYFKRAVDRNRIKRLVREAYRLQKSILLTEAQAFGVSGAIFFIYTDKEIHAFDTVYQAVGKCLEGLKQKVKVRNENAG